MVAYLCPLRVVPFIVKGRLMMRFVRFDILFRPC
mgnify:CR=1 FL=1